jgi:recombinational DNA repair protein (RecF pathway)
MLHFEIRALHLLGFLGGVDSCAVCSRPWPGGHRPAYYNPLAGGLICRGCNQDADTPAGGAITLPGVGVRLLKDLSEMPSPPSSNGFEKNNLRQVHSCLIHSFTTLLERPLKMLRYQASWL